MGTIIPIDDKKKKAEKAKSTNTAKKAIGAFAQPEYNRFEQRNQILPDKQEMLEQLTAELQGYLDSEDTSVLTDIRGGQNEMLDKILEPLRQNRDQRGIFVAITRMFSEKDMVFTDQLNKLALCLIRLYELQRQNTTDILEQPTAKDILKDENFNLLAANPGSDQISHEQMVMVLKNVENAEAGTTQLDYEALLQTRHMVQTALRKELKVDYQAVLPPHQIEAPQGDMKLVKTDVDPKVILYLRLFESLTIAVMKQQAITKEKRYGLGLKRVEILDSLGRLARIPGIAMSESLLDQLKDKMSVMDLDQLDFFEFKVKDLHEQVAREEETTEEANSEIQGWLDPQIKFSKEELHRDLERRKAEEKQKTESAKRKLADQIASGKVSNVIEMPVRQGIKPEDIKKPKVA